MDQPIGVARLIEPQPVAAQADRFFEPLLPAGVVGQLGPLEDHSHGDLAARVVEAIAQQLLARPIDGHQVASPGVLDLVEPFSINEGVSHGKSDANHADGRCRIGRSRRWRNCGLPVGD